jgi:hypothetical protein
MDSEDAVASGDGDFNGNPVDAAYSQGASMGDLQAQANEIYNNLNLGFEQKAAALDSILSQANAINPVSNLMSGEQYLLNMDANRRGETVSGPYNGPGFGHFTGFGLANYEGPTSENENYELPVLSGQAEEDATTEMLRQSEAERASAVQSSNVDGGGDDLSGNYYSDLINQMAGDDRSNQIKGNQYAANVSNTATDAEDFGTVNIFEDPPIKNETFDRLDEQNENASNVLNSIGEGLNAYEAAALNVKPTTAYNPSAVSNVLNELFGIGPAQAADRNINYGAMFSPYAAQGQLLDPNAAALFQALQDSKKAASTEQKYGFNAFDPSAVRNATTLGGAPNAELVRQQEFTAATTPGSQISDYTIGLPKGQDFTKPGTLSTDYKVGPITSLATKKVPSTSVAPTDHFSGVYQVPADRGQIAGSGSANAPGGQGQVQGQVQAEGQGQEQVQGAGPLTVKGAATGTGGAGQPTAMSATGYEKNVPREKLWSDLPFGTGSPIGPDAEMLYTPVDTTTADVTPAVVDPANATMRRYLGAGSDLYRYGMGPERTYYAAAAQGGYFNADQYFANGGLVSPMQPPSQSTVPPFPTMAFTDGGGPVGSIAQPPGLLASDSVGSDAPHASPMAPSVAASVPTMQPGLATLSMRNVNASPAPSPISQNPNVGYALGQSPLSNV